MIFSVSDDRPFIFWKLSMSCMGVPPPCGVCIICCGCIGCMPIWFPCIMPICCCICMLPAGACGGGPVNVEMSLKNSS